MSSTDEEFDEELRRLFADERLGLRPRAGAGQAILAGARRVRRRRVLLTSGGGTLAVALLAGGVLLLGGEPSTRTTAAPATGEESTSLAIEEPTAPPSSPASSTAASVPEQTSGGQRTSSNPPPPAETPPPQTSGSPRFESSTVASPVLGPDGYGVFKLGMSTEEAKATGRLGETVEADAKGCVSYRFTDEANAASRLRISAEGGLVGLYPGGPAQTPEGIGEGSTLAKVRATYPALTGDQGSYTAPAGQNAVYRIGVDTDRQVVSRLALEAQPQPCSGAS
ncbi:hypothetical protein [Amycolatopsis aidingensis]|uniref:hypothetical protein n=1 Tax=Amycolatopsis aidingensis TaxID=2842453 RepID=UPI001C0AEFDC|nr:hypothetical protein [Amycolatopsis aidingensis]